MKKCLGEYRSMSEWTPHPKPEKPRYYFKEWRKKAGLTQEQVAERIGLTPSSISQLENGIQGFSNTTLEALAWAYSCEPADLLGRNPLKEGKVVDLVAKFSKMTDDERDAALKAIEFSLSLKRGT